MTEPQTASWGELAQYSSSVSISTTATSAPITIKTAPTSPYEELLDLEEETHAADSDVGARVSISPCDDMSSPAYPPALPKPPMLAPLVVPQHRQLPFTLAADITPEATTLNSLNLSAFEVLSTPSIDVRDVPSSLVPNMGTTPSHSPVSLHEQHFVAANDARDALAAMTPTFGSSNPHSVFATIATATATAIALAAAECTNNISPATTTTTSDHVLSQTFLPVPSTVGGPMRARRTAASNAVASIRRVAHTLVDAAAAAREEDEDDDFDPSASDDSEGFRYRTASRTARAAAQKFYDPSLRTHRLNSSASNDQDYVDDDDEYEYEHGHQAQSCDGGPSSIRAHGGDARKLRNTCNNKSLVDSVWSDKELTMPTRAFNAHIKDKGYSKEQIKHLRKARRRLKNREYAKRSRVKKHHDDVEQSDVTMGGATTSMTAPALPDYYNDLPSPPMAQLGAFQEQLDQQQHFQLSLDASMRHQESESERLHRQVTTIIKQRLGGAAAAAAVSSMQHLQAHADFPPVSALASPSQDHSINFTY